MENGDKKASPFTRFGSLYSDARVNITVSCHGKNVRSHSEKLLLHGES